jgi:hypothetical protein
MLVLVGLLCRWSSFDVRNRGSLLLSIEYSVVILRVPIRFEAARLGQLLAMMACWASCAASSSRRSRIRQAQIVDVEGIRIIAIVPLAASLVLGYHWLF